MTRGYGALLEELAMNDDMDFGMHTDKFVVVRDGAKEIEVTEGLFINICCSYGDEAFCDDSLFEYTLDYLADESYDQVLWNS